MYKRILISTDGSALARAAIDAGVKLAKAVGARVTGFHATPPATPLEYKGMFPVGYSEPAERARAIEKAAAKRNKCDLIFIAGSHLAAGLPARQVSVTTYAPLRLTQWIGLA